MQLEGTVCVITGATGGIGHALAHTLARRGARLVLAARNLSGLEVLMQELPGWSVATVCAGDLTRAGDREALAAAAREHGAIALVNVCGGNRFGLLAEQSDADVDALVTLNLIAPMALTRSLLPYLKRRSEAMIVNVGSAFDVIGFPGYVLYCASKFGLRGFSEALARELSDTAVTVLHVAPRATRTAMNPPAVTAMNQALGNAEDPPQRVAEHIADAMERGRRRTAIGWRERVFARINQLLPAVVDRALNRQLALIKRFASHANQEEAQP